MNGVNMRGADERRNIPLREYSRYWCRSLKMGGKTNSRVVGECEGIITIVLKPWKTLILESSREPQDLVQKIKLYPHLLPSLLSHTTKSPTNFNNMQSVMAKSFVGATIKAVPTSVSYRPVLSKSVTRLTRLRDASNACCASVRL